MPRRCVRHGGDFAADDFVEHRQAGTGELPRHLVKVRSGNDETVHYFHCRKRNWPNSAVRMRT